MIIVFGGAFNPVTNAHLEVCDFLLQENKNATFLFLPVSSAYTKSELASNFHRVNMLKLALKEKKRVQISQIEISDSDFLGTYQSLIRISDAYQDEVRFVVGADNLITMHKWMNIHGLLSEFKIIVLGRYGIDISGIIDKDPVLSRHRQQFITYPNFNMEMSSTGFRETFDPTMVPAPVYKYIIENELYRGEEDVQE